MSERQKLLDAARSAVNLLDAAQSAVELLTTVLGKEDENGSHGNRTQQRCVVTGDIQHTDSKNTSDGWKTQVSEGRAPLRGATVLKTKDDSKLRAKNTTLSKCAVAKVTPQRPIAFEKRDDVVTDGSIGGRGGGIESRIEGWDHSFNEFFFEQAQASSILVLENAKLREELHETKTEVAALNDELSMKPKVNQKDVEVQTICAHLFSDNFQRIQGFSELTSDDEDTDYLTTYSNSSPDRRYAIQANRSDIIGGKRGSDVYFCTPASVISTPGTLGRSTVSSSGGGLIRRKLELPKSLKRGGGYLSITSYEALTSDEDESSMTSQGCCPFACFGCLGGRKSARE